MRVCFLARPVYDKLSTELFLQLKKLNWDFEAVFITQNTENTNYIKKKIEGACVYQVSEYLEKNWNDFSMERLSRFENKYNCAPIWKYILTDRFLINFDYEYVIKTTCGLFAFYEEIFKEGNCDYYYDEIIAVLQSYIAYLVGKHYGVKYISQMVARGADSTHHYFLCDPFQYNCNFNKRYKESLFSEERYRFAEGFLKEFESKNITPANMVYTGSKPRIYTGYFTLPFAYIKKRLSSKYNNKYDYINYLGYKNTFNALKFYFKYHRSKKYYEQPDYRKKFVYFPLHYQPEASTLVCAQKYEKQLYYIDSWSKSLPADTVLYVKEHYAVLGHRDMEFYKQLKKYPNVVLIDPWISSRELILKSVAVTTLTGTAGWEAMLLRKPVFLGGNIFFDNAPGIIKVDEIFGNYMNNINDWSQPTREEVILYLCEYFDTIYEGNVYAASPACYDKENIEKLAKSLINQIQRMESD